MAILGQNGQFGSKWVIEAQNGAKNGQKHVLMTFYDFLWFLNFFLIFDPKMTPNDHPTCLFGPLAQTKAQKSRKSRFSRFWSARCDLNRARAIPIRDGHPFSKFEVPTQCWSGLSGILSRWLTRGRPRQKSARKRSKRYTTPFMTCTGFDQKWPK